MSAPCAFSAPSLIMHQTSFNGGLYWGCPIAGFRFDANFMLTIVAAHETRYDSFEGSIFSLWKINGLETHLVCNEKNQLAWLSPTGDTANFDKAQLAKQKNVVDKGKMLVSVSEDEHVVIDEYSRKWFYRRGSLEKVQFGNNDELSFKCDNGRIREITHGKDVTLSVQRHGANLAFFIKDRRIAEIQYDARGRLIELITFADPRRQPLEFIYQNDILSQIKTGDRAAQKFDWREVGFWQKWFSLLPYPVYLYSDERYTYAHECYFGRAKITATDMSGHHEEKILNLKSGLITDRK